MNESPIITEPYPRWPSIPRLLREVVITEKLDGTNGLIRVTEAGQVLAGSRNHWLTPVAVSEDKATDNYGFAAWVAQNEDELRKLGPGDHYGEFWGQGIARKYGLTEKRFSLFNTGRWHSDYNDIEIASRDTRCRTVECCHVVPVIHGCTSFHLVDVALEYLAENGSDAAPGFMNPEGIVVYHTKSKHYYKVTLDHNDGHKGA